MNNLSKPLIDIYRYLIIDHYQVFIGNLIPLIVTMERK